MSIEDLFDHSCNIFHIVKTSTPKGYGLPNQNAYSYSEVPDLESIPCHFKQVVDGVSITLNSPNKELQGDFILKLPIGTDIRTNDKVIDLESNLVYTAHVPRSVRDNHVKVKLKLEQSL